MVSRQSAHRCCWRGAREVSLVQIFCGDAAIVHFLLMLNRFGHVFMAETGTSVGEISGQSKQMNSCDFRPSRPFRIVTASEDNTVAFFEGPPFKFKCTKQVI